MWDERAWRPRITRPPPRVFSPDTPPRMADYFDFKIGGGHARIVSFPLFLLILLIIGLCEQTFEDMFEWLGVDTVEGMRFSTFLQVADAHKFR